MYKVSKTIRSKQNKNIWFLFVIFVQGDTIPIVQIYTLTQTFTEGRVLGGGGGISYLDISPLF